MKTTTKLNLLALAVTAMGICTTARALDIRIGNTPARAIAKDMSIPGKGVDGQCLPFALALHERFQAAGIASKVIVYRYNALSTFASEGIHKTEAGAHAVVAYDDRGRVYVMDNQSWLPTWVKAGTIKELAEQFSGMNVQVGEARLYAANTRAPSRAVRPASPVRKPVLPTVPAGPKAPEVPQAKPVPNYVTVR